MIHKKIFKIVLLIALCLNFTGCFQSDTNLKVSDSGEVTLRHKIIGISYISGIIEESKDSILKSNPDAKVRPVKEDDFSGYEIEIFYPDLKSFSANGMSIFQVRPGKAAGIQISKGWFSDTCTFDFIETAESVKDNALDNAMARAMLSQVKCDFSIELPYAAESTNADFMSNDGKILTWNIAPNLLNGQDKFMKVTFKIYHKLRIVLTFFLALLFIGGVIYNLSQSKNKQPKNNEQT